MTTETEKVRVRGKKKKIKRLNLVAGLLFMYTYTLVCNVILIRQPGFVKNTQAICCFSNWIGYIYHKKMFHIEAQGSTWRKTCFILIMER